MAVRGAVDPLTRVMSSGKNRMVKEMREMDKRENETEKKREKERWRERKREGEEQKKRGAK